MFLYEPLLNLIKTDKNWKKFLKQEPRFVDVKQCPWKDEEGNVKYPNLYMLSYNGILSDFNDQYVRLCRGCIVSVEDKEHPQMICAPLPVSNILFS